MKISNFRAYTKSGLGSREREHATVDVTTGVLWWKKTEPRGVCRELGGYWFFVDSGQFTPRFDVESLARAYHAQEAAQ